MVSPSTALKYPLIIGALSAVALLSIFLFALKFDQIGHEGHLSLTETERFYDPDASLSIDTLPVPVPQNPATPELSNELKPTTVGQHWVRYDIKNLPSQYDYVKVDMAWLDHVSAYFVNTQGKYRQSIAGDNDTFVQRAIGFRKPVFPVVRSIDGMPVEAIVFKVSAQGYFSFPLVALTDTAFHTRANLDHLFYGAWLSILVALGSYNAILFFTLRNGLHIYYAAYILSYAALLTVASGMAQQYLWPGSSGVTTPAAHASLAITNLTTVLFATHFMSLGTRMPRTTKALLALGISSIVLIPFAIVLSYSALGYMLLCSFAIMAIVFTCALNQTIRGNASAPFLLASYVVLVPSNAIALMRFMGLYEDASWAEHLAELGLLVEAGILSFGIASRVNALKKEKDGLALAQERERASFARELVYIKEQERKSIGKALHDSLGHKIIAAKTMLQPQTVRQTEKRSHIKSSRDKASHDKDNRDTVEILDETLNELRDLSQLLYPAILDDLGLKSAVSALAKRALTPAEITYSVQVNCHKLDQETELLFYRAAQECISNVIKHSGAENFQLTIDQKAPYASASFTACDDGKPSLSNDNMGFGLGTLQKNVELLGGRFWIGINDAKKNCITIELPTQ